jgi:hypothetical protein
MDLNITADEKKLYTDTNYYEIIKWNEYEAWNSNIYSYG